MISLTQRIHYRLLRMNIVFIIEKYLDRKSQIPPQQMTIPAIMIRRIVFLLFKIISPHHKIIVSFAVEYHQTAVKICQLKVATGQKSQ